MIKRHLFMISAVTLWSPLSAAAQTTLDRVDPTRVEAKELKPTRKPADVTLPVLPAPAVSVAPAEAPITIGAISLSGLKALRPVDFADVFEIYVGRTLSPPALAGLTDAIADRARARGYVFATASIPPQALTAGVLRVDIDEGRVDEIRLGGNANKAVRKALMPLVGDRPVTLTEVERRLLIAGDIDGIWLRRTRFVRENGRNILEVDVGGDRVFAMVGIDNSGSRPIGPIQADATVRIAQLLADDDSVTVTALATPAEPSEFGYARVRYAKRVASDGTELSWSVSYARTAPGAYVKSRDITGRSWTSAMAVLHPLLRRRDQSLWLEGNIGIRTVEQDRRDLLVRRDRLTVGRVGLYGFTDIAGGRLRANATVSQGVDLLGATLAGDPLASRDDGSARFTSVMMGADWKGPLIGALSAQVAVATQLASRPLLVSEETGLGGGAFLRGYDYSERSGDQGVMASAEFRYTVAQPFGMGAKPQIYTFVDGGKVTNLRGGIGSGTLVSAGGGVRSDIFKTVTADVGVAVPLSGIRYDSGNADPVINLRMTKRF